MRSICHVVQWEVVPAKAQFIAIYLHNNSSNEVIAFNFEGQKKYKKIQ